MDQQQLQRTRYLLHARFRRITNAEPSMFGIVCGQVFDWLENHPIISSIVQYLDTVPGDHHEEIALILDTFDRPGGFDSPVYISMKQRPKSDGQPDFKGYTPKTLEQHASACLQVIRAAILKPEDRFYIILATYLTQQFYLPNDKSSKRPFEYSECGHS